MAVSKVTLKEGNERKTLIDLTQDTAIESDVAQGKTFHLADGTQAVGTATGGITPAGTISITENGTYDVTDYASANVSVSSGSSEKFNQMVEKTLTELTAEDLAGVTYIGVNSFADMENLSSAIIPSNVETIRYAAFNNDTNLISLTIENGLRIIEELAFGSCLNLSNVTLPSSVTYIGNSIFSSCVNLMSVTIMATTPPTAESDAFYATNCAIYVPEESVDLYKNETNWAQYASRIYPIGTVVNFHRLDLAISGDTYGYVVGDGGNYIVGSDIWLEAYENPDGQFVNWTENGVEISTDMSFNYTMPDYDVTLVANFQARSLDINTGNYSNR